MAEINRGLGVYRGIMSARAMDYKLPLLGSKHPITSIIFLHALNSEGRAVIHNFSFLSRWTLIWQWVLQLHALISKVIIEQNATLHHPRGESRSCSTFASLQSVGVFGRPANALDIFAPWANTTLEIKKPHFFRRAWTSWRKRLMGILWSSAEQIPGPAPGMG